MTNRIKTHLPIIAVQPAKQSTVLGEIDEVSVRLAYIQLARLQGGEVNFIQYNQNCRKVESSVPPYCAICQKSHDGSNAF